MPPSAPSSTQPPQAHEEAQREFALTLSGFTAKDKPEYADYARCVHCGLCLNHCPTYRLWGREADSPRGRIRQMALVDQGRLELGESFVTHIDRCLDCRACETACPSGVEYGKLIELTRAQIEQKYRRRFASRVVREFVYRRLLPYPKRIARVARAMRLYQASGMAALARSTGVLRLLGLQNRERLMPKIDREFFFGELGKTFPARGERRARVAFFAGCIAQVTFAELNRATIRVLQANGCEVVVPAGQVCCGALAAHAGVRDVARDLAAKNMRAFGGGGFDAIVTNAAGCGSTLKEYPDLFPSGESGGDSAKPARARVESENECAEAFSGRVRDMAEFLAELGLTATLKSLPLRITYQDSCHLAHGQKIREAPRKLIRAIPGVELVEMQYADQCCGSAGVYNVTQTQASLELLAQKMECARETKAPVIVTANPGCLLQMRAGAAIHRTGQEVLHVVELLDRATSL
ncbi:MAG TPA: (Fe-S)-binding protein [Candidatus Acidoferrales bacterium]|nr:(Fe-S)-binding protein [Candidatus Acidoferrales bacterium]